jgi:hypothetical protein
MEPKIFQIVYLEEIKYAIALTPTSTLFAMYDTYQEAEDNLWRYQ